MADERTVRAGEYVLGTLSADERADFERQLQRDPALARELIAWERRLAPLAETVPAVAPSAGLWARIDSEAGFEERRRRTNASARRLVDKVAFWRWTTLAGTAAAAGFAAALLIAVLPSAPPAGGRFVAALQTGGESPPVVVTVDLPSNSLAVRSLAATAPADRSYEVWYIGAGEAPRSLGVLDEVGEVIQTALSEIDNFHADGAVFAITLEPRGGSPTGSATGPIVYSGPLVQQSL